MTPSLQRAAQTLASKQVPRCAFDVASEFYRLV